MKSQSAQWIRLIGVLAAVVLAMADLRADTATNRLSKGAETLKGDAMTNGVWWLDAETNPCAASEILDSQVDYVVGPPSSSASTTLAANIRTCENADTVFSGRSLTIGCSTYSKGYARLYATSGSPYWSKFENEGLILQHGAISLLDRKNTTFSFYGKITVLGTGSGNKVVNVVGGKAEYTGQTVVFYGPLLGGDTAVLSVGGKFAATTTTALFMDIASYSGRLDCDNGNTLGACGSSAASIKINSGGIFRTVTPTNGLTIASMTMATGSVFKVVTDKWVDANGVSHPTNALVRVTDTLSVGDGLGGTASIAMSMADICFDGLTNRFAILAAPKAAGLSTASFSLDFDMGVYPEDMRRLASLVVEEGETEDVLAVVFQPVVRLVTGDNNKQTGRSTATTSMEDGKENHWSDGRLPHSGAHYLVLTNGLSTAAKYLNTMGAGSGQNPGDDYEARHFPGESLTIGGNCFLTIYQRPTLQVKELRLLDGAYVRVGQQCGDTVVEGERVVAPSGTVNVSVFSSFTLEFTGDLSGSALIRIAGPTGTSSPTGSTHFSGDDSEFAGKFLVTQGNYNKGPPSLNVQQSLIVAGTDELGGTIPEMAWDGIWLRRMSRLLVTSNAVLTAGTNRGLYIDSTSDVEDTVFYGRVNVNSGKDFKVETQLTMNGHLRKEGVGSLTLAAPVKFGEGATSDTPLANSNLLSVIAGTLRVGSADGIDGLEVRFSSGTSLVRGSGSAADADFLRYGIRNVKTETPFVLADGMAKLPLTIEYPESFPENGATFGILTVTNSIAAGIRDLLPSVPSRVGDRSAQLVEVADAENGWMTFAVKITAIHGMQLNFR